MRIHGAGQLQPPPLVPTVPLNLIYVAPGERMGDLPAAEVRCELPLRPISCSKLTPSFSLPPCARAGTTPVPTIAISSIREGLFGVRDRAATKGAQRISTDVFVGNPAE